MVNVCCRCCGYKYEDDCFVYSICPVCDWENEPIPDDYVSSANGNQTLKQYKDSYLNKNKVSNG